MSKNLLNFFFIVLSFVLYLVVIKPLNTGVGTIWQPEESIQSLRNKDNQYTETLKQADSLYKQAEKLSTEYSLVSNETKEKLDSMVGTDIDPVRLLNDVNKIANESGLAIKDLTYSEGVSNESYRTYLVSFSVSTNYTKFKEMIYKFEKSIRLFTVKSISFSISDKDEALNSFKVNLETYYIK